MPIPALYPVIPVAPDGLKLRYQVEDPLDVAAVTRLRLFTTSARTGTAAYDVGPAATVPGIAGLYEFTLPPVLTPGLYFLIITVSYVDGSTADDRNDTLAYPLIDTGLVTLSDYQRLTGDRSSTPDDVAAALLDAQQIIEEYLRRPLMLATRTERLRLYRADGIDSGYDGAYLIYPTATPVLSAPGFTVLDDISVAGAFPDGGPFLDGIIGQSVQPYATITYTGGYTPATLPATIRREIARTAAASLTPTTAVPTGAVSVRVGDTAVTYATAGLVGAALSPSSKTALKRYTRRRGA